MVTQLIKNQIALKEQLNKQSHYTIKMPLIKYFIGEAYKLKKFFTQIKIKITNKGLGLLTAIKQIVYIGLFLTKKVLEWFEPYFTKIQLNRLNTTNIEVQYIFLI